MAKGSSWGIWDLQVQTIYDNDYDSLESYYQELKDSDQEKWEEFVEKVGSEEDALTFDKRDYFFNGQTSVRNRVENYAKLFFSFLEVYSPDVKCVAITDHNADHPELLSALHRRSDPTKCGMIAGTEINLGGIHVLVLFSVPPFDKSEYSDGIKTFLGQVGVTSRNNTEGSYMLTSGVTYKELLQIVTDEGGMCIFPHANSENGLFQERPKTDPTFLANIYNAQNPVVLQCQTKRAIDNLERGIAQKPLLKSTHIKTIAPDSRCLREIGRADEDGNFLYVKGEPTFEGFRQAIYEPDSRIFIGSDRPIDPIHHISTVEFSFPESTKLSDERFCMAGDSGLTLSPNYTCFIGGRGTGKSTILNLMHSTLSKGKNKFFQDNRLTDDGKYITASDYVEIDDNEFTERVDFISQNEIESFASNQESLTEMLSERIEQLGGGELAQAKENLKKILEDYGDHLSRVIEVSNLTIEIEEHRREKRTQDRLVKSFKSEEYKDISRDVSAKTEALSDFEESKETFEELAESVSDLVKLYTPQEEEEEDSGESEETQSEESVEESIDIPPNGFDGATEAVLSKLLEAQDIIDGIDHDALSDEKQRLEGAVKTAKSALGVYLEGKNLTFESQEDVANASTQSNALANTIKKKKSKLASLEKKGLEFDLQELKKAKDEFNNIVEDQIVKVNKQVKDLGEHVKTIELRLRSDAEKMKENIYEEFKDVFEVDPRDMGTKDNALYEALFPIEPDEIRSKEKFLGSLGGGLKKRELNKAKKSLIDMFSDEDNFTIFKIVVEKHLHDSTASTQIDVFYDSRPLQDTSFGQRCTATLILILLLGNNPIVIDEPEGHLDSLLIANFLVDLIKKAKANRQIIFATHNANLVVNGDAELIYHLEMNEDGKTVLNPTVLEDTENRHRIIGLEGGPEAFKKRELKYQVDDELLS